MSPLLRIGAGRMATALVEGWSLASTIERGRILVRSTSPLSSTLEGVVENPTADQIASAATVVLAVKPHVWREALEPLAAELAPDAVVVSVMAGVPVGSISQVLGGRAVARVMPTTAVAIAQGVASLFATSDEARRRAHALFGPIATVVDFDEEHFLHAATAISGSGPAYLYAFMEALEAVGLDLGLTVLQSARLTRATIAGAATLMSQSGQEPADLRRQVTSPNGTTAAALAILMGHGGLRDLLGGAVAAAACRSRELAGEP